MTQQDLREKRAMELFRSGYNCCQSVALAFADVIGEKTGMSRDQIAAVTSGFGGGFARLREVCGSVSGMTFVAGALIPAPADPTAHPAAASTSTAPAAHGPGPVTVLQASVTPASVETASSEVPPKAGAAGASAVDAKEARRANYALVQEMAARFREENGSIICRELLGIRTSGQERPMPSDRTPEYYAARPCERLVGSAARILSEKVLKP